MLTNEYACAISAFPSKADIDGASVNVCHDVQAIEGRTEGEVVSAFRLLRARRVSALIVVGDAFLVSQRDQIVALAARHAVPTIYDSPDRALAGGSISYGSNLKDSMRLAGVYASKILRGARPADLPVQQPTK